QLKLLHDGSAVRDLRHGKVQRRIARHPNIFLGVEREGANTDPGLKGFHLGGIIGGKTHSLVRLGVAYPDSILGVDDDIEGRLEPFDFDDTTILDASTGEMEQQISRTLGNPDVAAVRDPNAHQTKEFLLEREVAVLGDRTAVEIHDEDLAVEARGPDVVARHRGAPADSVQAHAGEASDRRGKRGPAWRELDYAPPPLS